MVLRVFQLDAVPVLESEFSTALSVRASALMRLTTLEWQMCPPAAISMSVSSLQFVMCYHFNAFVLVCHHDHYAASAGGS